MTQKAPGKSDREGITLVQLHDLFPTEKSAREWFEARIWPDGRHCPRCGSVNTSAASHKKMPYWCTDCRSYFSVKIGTALEGSRVSLRKWAFAIYLHLTSLKGVSSMKLHRDIGVTQSTGWFMLQRIRKAWEDGDVLLPARSRSMRPISAARRATSTRARTQSRPWHGRQGCRRGCEGSQDQQGQGQGHRKDRCQNPTEVRRRYRRQRRDGLHGRRRSLQRHAL